MAECKKKKKCGHFWTMWCLDHWTCVKCGATQKENPYKET